MGTYKLIDNVKVYGLRNSFRVSKFPMQVDVNNCSEEYTKRIKTLAGCERGSGHDNFLKGIIVQFDLSFTVKAWTEGERYHCPNCGNDDNTMMDIAFRVCGYIGTAKNGGNQGRYGDIHDRVYHLDDMEYEEK